MEVTDHTSPERRTIYLRAKAKARAWATRAKTRIKGLKKYRHVKYTAPAASLIGITGHIGLAFSSGGSVDPSIPRAGATGLLIISSALNICHPIVCKLVKDLEEFEKQAQSPQKNPSQPRDRRERWDAYYQNKILPFLSQSSNIQKIRQNEIFRDYLKDPFKYFGETGKMAALCLICAAVSRQEALTLIATFKNTDLMLAMAAWVGNKALTLQPSKNPESYMGKIRNFIVRRRHPITGNIFHFGAVPMIVRGFLLRDWGRMAAGISYFTCNNVLAITDPSTVPPPKQEAEPKERRFFSSLAFRRISPSNILRGRMRFPGL